VKERNVIFYSALSIIFTITLFVVGVSTYVLYQNAITHEKEHLLEGAVRLANIVEVVCGSRPDHHQTSGDLGLPPVCQEVVASLNNPESMTKLSAHGYISASCILGRKDENNRVNFAVTPKSDKLSPVLSQKGKITPMGKALSDETGTVVTQDHLGRTVAAAYVPISSLKWALVAEIPIENIKKDFVRAAFLSLLTACFLVVAGVFLMMRLWFFRLRKSRQSSEMAEEVSQVSSDVSPAVRYEDQNAVIEPSEAPLDYQRFIKDMCYNKKDLAIKLINMLVDQRGPQLLGDLSVAIAKKDAESISSICHTLKGTAANMCANSLSEKADEFKQVAQCGQDDRYAGLLADITKSFDSIVIWWHSQDNGVT